MEAQQVATATKEELVNRYIELGFKEEELAAEKQVLKEEILLRLSGDGETIGDFNVTRVVQERFNFGKVTLDQAKEFGAVKEAVDNDVLKKLHQSGVKLPFEVTVLKVEYPLIKPISAKE